MTRWDAMVRVGALLAALLLGAAPPGAEDAPPGRSSGFISEEHGKPRGTIRRGSKFPASPFRIASEVPEVPEPTAASRLQELLRRLSGTKRRETVLLNHVFAAPREPGRLLMGSDPDFLLYPPDVSPECEHRGPGETHAAPDVEFVPVAWDDARPWARPRPEVRSNLCGPPIHTSPHGGRYWDVLCPADAFTSYRRPNEGGRVEILFSGEVRPGRALMATRPTPTPAPVEDSKTHLVPVYASPEEFTAEQQKEIARREAMERLNRHPWVCDPYIMPAGGWDPY